MVVCLTTVARRAHRRLPRYHRNTSNSQEDTQRQVEEGINTSSQEEDIRRQGEEEDIRRQGEEEGKGRTNTHSSLASQEGMDTQLRDEVGVGVAMEAQGDSCAKSVMPGRRILVEAGASSAIVHLLIECNSMHVVWCVALVLFSTI